MKRKDTKSDKIIKWIFIIGLICLGLFLFTTFTEIIVIIGIIAVVAGAFMGAK